MFTRAFRNGAASAIAAVSTAVLTAACQPAPYPLEMVVEGHALIHQEARAYVAEPGSSPRPSKGPVGYGTSCTIAEDSSGELHFFREGTRTYTSRVIGEMPVRHPLSPEGSFSKARASIIEVIEETRAEVNGEETWYEPGAVPERSALRIEAEEFEDTRAFRYGVAEGEYLVSFSNLGEVWSGAEPNWQLMTRSSPRKGDMWPSMNGNILYQYEETERIEVAGQTVRADRIALTAIGSVHPDDTAVLDTCVRDLSTAVSQQGAGNPVNDTIVEAYLDPGCEGGFVHARVGTEWWADGVLVRREATNYLVEIDDYGFEWYDATGGFCVRETSMTRDVDSARRFVHYTLVTEEEVFEVTRLE